jgi:hypothetical protein
MSWSVRWCCLTVAAALVATGFGCTPWRVGEHDLVPWHKEEPQQPTKVVAMWSPTVLNQSDRPSTRGFGGRLMFYAAKEDKAVMVEGTLVVYGFNETPGKKGQPRPDRKYVFTREQFTRHYSKSGLGHSYSVWIPWDDALGSPCKVSLIVRFIPKQGAVVIGEQTTLLLPGPGPTPAEMDAKVESSRTTTPASGQAQPNMVRQISHEAEIVRPLAGPGSAEMQGQQIRTTTIPIPLQSRLARGASPAVTATPPVAMAVTAATVAGTAQPAGAAQPAAVTTPAAASTPASPGQRATSPLPRMGRYTLARTRPLGDPIPLPRADRAGWPLPVAAARTAVDSAPAASPVTAPATTPVVP